MTRCDRTVLAVTARLHRRSPDRDGVTVRVVEPALSWLRELRKQDRGTARLIGAAVEVLKEAGPSLGRPLVDTIKGSSIRNLKELRPGSVGTSERRVLFDLIGGSRPCYGLLATYVVSGSSGIGRRSPRRKRRMPPT